MDKLEHIPSESDYEEVMFAISRLHLIYQDKADFTKPTLENHADFLTGILVQMINLPQLYPARTVQSWQ